MKKVKGRPQPFGAAVEGNRVNFAVQVPAGDTCELLLYEEGKCVPKRCFDMPEEEGIGEVRYLAVEDMDAAKYEYNFRIGGKVCLDPYVKEIAGKEQFGKERDHQKHQVRGKLVSPEYDWGDDRSPRIPWHEVVAYSLHVRGFTKHRSSKVKHKGTFAGIIEKLPYIQELGVNQIQCMPVYEFEECKASGLNYWGYGEAYYFAPKESYSSGKSAVRELKDLVRACHEQGIEVILEMPFTEGIPAHIVIECLRFYVMEYHIDGFVVNPYNVSWEMLKKDPFLKGIKLMRKEDGFQNIMRRYLKGDENMVNDVIWALRHHSAEDGKCNYITTHTGFTLADLVSYDRKHNEENGENNQDGPDFNFSWNCGVEGASRKKTVVTLRRNQVRNAFFLLLTAQGTPCILAGDEFGNSQKGNNNVYCQDNETGWVNWSKLYSDGSLFQFVKSLIAFRKKNGCLHRETELKGADRTACGIPDVSYHGESAWQVLSDTYSRQLGVMYAADGEAEGCFAAYNMHWIPHSFALPSYGRDRRWYIAASTGEGILEHPLRLEDQKRIVLKARSVALLIGVKEAPKKESMKSEADSRMRKEKPHESETKNETESTEPLSDDHKTQNACHEGVLPAGIVPPGPYARPVQVRLDGIPGGLSILSGDEKSE